MTSPSAYIREENQKLGKIAKKIKFVPYRFSGDGKTVNLKKVMRVLNQYGT